MSARDAADAPPQGLTPSQTVGPFFAYALTPGAYDYAALATNDLRTDDAVGVEIVVEGLGTLRNKVVSKPAPGHVKFPARKVAKD